MQTDCKQCDQAACITSINPEIVVKDLELVQLRAELRLWETDCWAGEAGGMLGFHDSVSACLAELGSTRQDVQGVTKTCPS